MALLPIVSFRTTHETVYFSRYDVLGGRRYCKKKEMTRNTKKFTKTERSTPAVALTPLKSILRPSRYSTYTDTRQLKIISTKAVLSTHFMNNTVSFDYHKQPSSEPSKMRQKRVRATLKSPGESLSKIHFKFTALRSKMIHSNSHVNQLIPFHDQLLSDLNRAFANIGKTGTIRTTELLVTSSLQSDSQGFEQRNPHISSNVLHEEFSTLCKRMHERHPPICSVHSGILRTSQDHDLSTVTKKLNSYFVSSPKHDTGDWRYSPDQRISNINRFFSVSPSDQLMASLETSSSVLTTDPCLNHCVQTGGFCSRPLTAAPGTLITQSRFDPSQPQLISCLNRKSSVIKTDIIDSFYVNSVELS
jgi:hypothetical protein